MLKTVGDWMTSAGLLALGSILAYRLIRDEIDYRRFKKETEQRIKNMLDEFRKD